MEGFRLTLQRRGLAALLTACAALGFASAASAATYTVNDTHDFAQKPTAASGSCTSTAGTCTLRAAVQASNENGGSNTINVPAGTYNLTNTTNPGTTPCDASNDDAIYDLKVNPCNNSTSITVIGAGSGSTVIDNSLGSSGDRLWTLRPNGTLDLQKMTLENGIGATSGTQENNDGGAVDSEGHFSAESVTFTGNTASGDGGAVAAESPSGSTVSVTGSVFQNNNGDLGGAVYTDAPSDVTLAFDLLQANSASSVSGEGGGIYGDGDASALTLNFDNLAQNVASTDGGGLLWDGTGALTISNSLFNQNQSTSKDGGGIFNSSQSANLTISNTSFDGNTASDSGGAMSDGVCDSTCTPVVGSNSLALTQDRFSGNSATNYYGGALELAGTSSVLTSNEFDSNTATSSSAYGGAIDWENGPLKIIGSSFVSNSSQYGGALDAASAIGATPGSTLTMVDSTLSRNTATSAGGAIFVYANTPATIFNDTLAFNNAPSGSGGGVAYDSARSFLSGGTAASGFGIENTTIAENSGGDCSAKFAGSFDLGNNDDSDQTCLGGLGGSNDLVGVNPLLANPANNGGPAAGGPGDMVTVQTNAEQSNSPTVDAGTNNGCPSVDERGASRPQGKACDIGAYEFGATPTTNTTTAITTSSSQTVTSTTTTHKPTKKPRKRCAKGKVRKHGKCVKKHKKHRHKHKKQHKK